MRSSLGLSSLIAFTLGIGAAFAQTLNPVLGNIQSPYNPLQGSVKIAGVNWGAGAVAYGPVGTPLVLSGSSLGGGGTVQFVPYKNGVVDTSVTPAQATVTLWTSTMLILTVPSGAMSGLVTVTVEGKTSNGLPFIVMPGSYSGSCPAGPTNSQLQIVTSSLHDGAIGQTYSATLQATGGTASYAWSIAGGTLPSGLTLNSSTGTISGSPTSATGSNPVPLTIQVTDSSSPRETDEAEMTLTVQPQQMTSGTIYSYAVGYDGASNVTSFQDKTANSGPGIMGAWSMTGPTGGSGYDSLNRLMGANVTWPDGTQQYLCWSDDPFGNRGQQEISSAAFQSGSGGPNSCNAQSSATLETDLSSYSSNNQVTSTNARGVSATPGYDASGDMTSDGENGYLYDAEGRVCAVQSSPLPGASSIVGYLYDGDGNRVAKGTLTNCTSLSNCSCDPTSNGFKFMENYVLGAGGEELTMLDGNNNWQRTNIFVGGKLIGTYDLVTNPGSSAQIPWLHFHFEDPLGSRRMQVSGMLNLGQPETDFQSLPYGDQLAVLADPNADPIAPISDSSPLHFTGKERDTESGNDYFGARYYISTMGRFMSPDWSVQEEPVPYAKLDDPQSLNLYSYVENNPLARTDPDGHCCEDVLQQAQQSGIEPIVIAATVVVTAAALWDNRDAIADKINDAITSVGKNGAANGQYGDFSAQAPANALQSNNASAPAATPAPAAAPAQATANHGTIYEVPGSGTKSGKPYIGKHKGPDPAKNRRSPDGRDRKQAKVVDTYDPSKPGEGQAKEQQHIDARGGIDNLDNKINAKQKQD